MLPDGRWTLIYPSGDYRTLQTKTVKTGGLVGKQILSIKEGDSFNGVAFLEGSQVRFWRRVRNVQAPERLARIQKAVERIVAAPTEAGLAYALKENRCCRCGKELTVPASLHRGMGSDCARRKPWTTADQQMAYDWAAAEARPA